jgi:hypothetical protein
VRALKKAVGEANDVERVLTRRLRDCYWPTGAQATTLDRVLAAEPVVVYVPEPERALLEGADADAFHLGRVHHFYQQLRRGRALDPILVESAVYLGGPIIVDGHHRFAAAVLARRRRVPIAFGGLLTTLAWLRGDTAYRNRPSELR